MNLFTIGFTQKSARQFFQLIQDNRVDIVVDIRLNNRSQLAGFSKGEDLEFFLDKICGCAYAHCIEYAPTKEILDSYKKKQITWEQYVEQYLPLMEKRYAQDKFWARFSGYENVCLLCSEPTAQYCHRRLLAELIAQKHPDIEIKHI